MTLCDVNGPKAHPAFRFLRKYSDMKIIKWNFAKYLLNGEGMVVKAYAP